MQITISDNIKQAKRQLNSIQKKQIPFATAKALTDTAIFSAVNLNDDTRRFLDRPTPFTQRAFTTKRATKRNLRSEVLARPIQEKYLHWQVYGGRREPEKRAIKLPKGVKLNKYGNIPRKAIARLLAQKATFNATINGVPGIWQRKGGKRYPIRLLVAWGTFAQYQPRFPMGRQVNRYVARSFPVDFDRALKRALRTAR